MVFLHDIIILLYIHCVFNTFPSVSVGGKEERNNRRMSSSTFFDMQSFRPIYLAFGILSIPFFFFFSRCLKCSETYIKKSRQKIDQRKTSAKNYFSLRMNEGTDVSVKVPTRWPVGVFMKKRSYEQSCES